MQRWEYMVLPLEAVGITLKRGDLVAWPVALLKRPRP